MDLCIIIPTLSRPTNSLTYVKETLSLNKHIFKKYKTCIYINETDLIELQPHIEDHTIISRVNHDEKLNMFTKGSYNYWRSHLCADFIYSMSQAVQLYPDCKTFMWLEDDILLHPRFEWILHDNFKWTANGHGATCLIFKKEYLISFIQIVNYNFLKDIPLDWMFDLFIPQTRLNGIIAFHIGIESTKPNCIRIENDREKYNTIAKSLREDESQRTQSDMQ